MVSRDREMSLLEHLQELRQRVVIAGAGVLVTTAVSFFFAEHVIRLLMAPGNVGELIVLNPTETFTTYMRVALFTGIGLAMPVILYQLFRYIDPALHPQERRFLLRMGLPIIALFVLGVAFCYYVVLPSALGFLRNFGSGVFETQWRANEYISFVTMFLLAMGLVFEMPAVLFALVRVRVLERRWLARQRRFVFLGSFLVAALITPTPDPFNQALVGLPLYLLFELGLFLARFAEPPRRAGEVLRPAP
jgi:sec-independent protein translocase protein TatC